jgi:hypothetical protein
MFVQRAAPVLAGAPAPISPLVASIPVVPEYFSSVESKYNPVRTTSQAGRGRTRRDAQ